MMGWRCICLLSIPCAAAAAPNATFGALADHVVWARINDTGSYDWPGSTLRHFTPVEAFDLLRGRHVLVLGNSVARHVVIALHLLIRGRAPEVHRIKIGGHALPAVESSVWERHGAASAELTPKQKYVSDACRHPNENMSAAAATVNCCVARRKASNYSFILTYAFTATPSEPQIRKSLGLWAEGAHCASSLAPDYVVLCLTQTDVVAFRALARQSAALRKRHPRTTFVLVTPPHVKGSTGLMLRAFDLAAVAESKPFDGVVALPLGESTARGINARVLKHDADNDHHFADAGRLFEVEMLLNAFSIASAAEPDRAATQEPAPWWFADKDARCYVGRYADLTRHFCAGGRCDLQKARDHYREHGRHEGRKYGCGDSSPAIVSSATSGRANSTNGTNGTAGPVVLFCADLVHSDGAWMHAFRSFLTLIVRSRKELPPGTRIHALLPQTVSVDGAVTNLPSVHLQLFNNESLHELARAAGFTFHRQAAGGCNSTACDLRIGTSKYTCATQFGREAPPLPLDSAACQRRHSATFCLALHHQQLWEVLRHRLKQLGSNETFRVSLPVYARSASPLNGACAAYPDACREVQRHVRLADTSAELDAYRRSRARSGGDWSSCQGSEGYAFVRWPLTGLNGTRTLVDFDGKRKWSGGVGEERMPPVGAAFPGGYPFHRLAADLVGIADGTYGLRCLHVNVFFSSKAPDTSDACLRDHRKCRAVDLAAVDPVHWESKQADQVLRIFARLAPGLQLCGNQPLRRVHCPAD